MSIEVVVVNVTHVRWEGKKKRKLGKKSQTTHCLFQLIENSCAVICKKKSQKLIVRSTRVEIY